MVVAKKGLAGPKRVVVAIIQRPKAFDLATRIGRRAQLPVTRGGKFVRLRSVPMLNRADALARRCRRWRRRPLRDRVAPGNFFPQQSAVVPSPVTGKTVALFPGCMTDRLYPEQGMAVIDMLRGLGVRGDGPEGAELLRPAGEQLGRRS